MSSPDGPTEPAAPGSADRARAAAAAPGSLCPRCAHLRLVTSAKGSVFLRCTLERTDPRFRRYPPQPVLACPGFRE